MVSTSTPLRKAEELPACYAENMFISMNGNAMRHFIQRVMVSVDAARSGFLTVMNRRFSISMMSWVLSRYASIVFATHGFGFSLTEGRLTDVGNR